MALSRTRDRAIIAPDTLTINDHGNAGLIEQAVASDTASAILSHTTQELLTLQLKELRIMNAYLAELIGCELTTNDLE